MIYLKKDFLIFSILSVLLFACSNDQSRNNEGADVNELIENFSTGLKDNDSLFIYINLSLDTEQGSANVLLSKEANQLYLDTYLIMENQTKKLGKIEYNISNDSLSFESILQDMRKNNDSDKKSSIVCTVKYRGDSLNFYSLDHINHMKNVGYFYSLLYKLYPNEREFQPVFPPSE